MKKISGLSFAILFFVWSETAAQTLLAADDFEDSLSFFTAFGAPAFYSGNSAPGDAPSSSPFSFSNNFSVGITNGSLMLTSDTIDVSNYTSLFLRLKLAAFSINNLTNGMDNSDRIQIEVSPNGGITYYHTIGVFGNTNAIWSYAGGTGSASTPYDGNLSAVNFMPAAGGNRTTDGYSTVTITNLPEVNNLRIRITVVSNFAAERWAIDNFEIWGTLVTGPLIKVNQVGIAGLSSENGTPSTEKTFQVEATNLTNDIAINAPAGFQVSATPGAGFGPSVSLTQTGGTVASTTVYVRMNSVVTGSNSGTISVSSTGANTRNIAVSGNVLALPPTVASSVSFANITDNAMDVNFSGGNGAARIVVMRLGSAVAGQPVDGINYNANASFELGNEIAPGEHVVYRGTGATIRVTGLRASSAYHVAVFEYNDEGIVTARNYSNVPGIGNTTTSIIAQGLEITATNTLFTIDFDNSVTRVNNGAFAGVTLAPAPAAGQLNSNAWDINGSSSSAAGVFGVTVNSGGGISAGNVTAGNFYAFEPVTGNRALGIQPTDAYGTPGAITLRLQNTTGSIIDTLALAFKWYVRNNENLGTSFYFTYSKNNLNYESAGFIDTSVVTADAPAGWKAYLRSIKLTGLAVANGSNIYLRWMIDDPVILSGIRDEFALDDIRIVAEPINVFPRASGNYENMRINGPVQLDGNTTVVSNINLHGANIQLGNYNITVGGNITSNASAYLQTNGTGSVTVNNVTTARLIPVGVTTYNPVTISNGSGLDWTVRVSDGIINTPAPFDPNIAVLRTWTITPSVNPPPAGADLTFQYNDGDVVQIGPNFLNTSDVQFWHFDGTDWTPASAAITPGGTPGGVRTVTLSNWTQFSSFTITNLVGSLPVEFGLIKATEVSGGVKITWENLTESDLQSYVVERSADGRQFMTLVQVDPVVNDGSKATYDWLDTSPNHGLNFYRIRATETGGKIVYSKILKVDLVKQQAQFLIVPNPVHNYQAQLSLSNLPKDNYSITIFSPEGRQLYSKSIFHRGGSAILTFPVPATIKPGLYIIHLAGKELKLNSKALIQ